MPVNDIHSLQADAECAAAGKTHPLTKHTCTNMTGSFIIIKNATISRVRNVFFMVQTMSIAKVFMHILLFI